MYKTLEIKDLFFTQESKRLEYERHNPKINVHWGQRKLLMHEIEFFTLFLGYNETICVYAGAAPGDHIPILSMMFPNIIFHLYDPRGYNIKETDKIKLFTGYFTDEIAESYYGKDVFFISDIRRFGVDVFQGPILKREGISEEEFDEFIKSTSRDKRFLDIKTEIDAAFEANVWEDMIMQQEWVKLINPEKAILKFKIPFPDYRKTEEDILTLNKSYLKGFVLKQIWQGNTSAETRLIPMKNEKGIYEENIWNMKEYEEMCFYHNKKIRPDYYKNPLNNSIYPIDSEELTNDYDSTAEAFIIKTYLERFNDIPNHKLEEYVIRFSRKITEFLTRKDKINLELLRKSESKSIKEYFKKLRPSKNHFKDPFRKDDNKNHKSKDIEINIADDMKLDVKVIKDKKNLLKNNKISTNKNFNKFSKFKK